MSLQCPHDGCDSDFAGKTANVMGPQEISAEPGCASSSIVERPCSTPPGQGPWPGVLVIMDAFGLTDDIRQQAGSRRPVTLAFCG